jgi:hypothetical protein
VVEEEEESQRKEPMYRMLKVEGQENVIVLI